MQNKPYYFSAFEPFGYQKPVLDIVYNYDYEKNFYPEILLSGSVGSAKSSLLAHIAISHCLRWRKARVAISRMGLPDLKKTIFQEILDALENDPNFTEGIHYRAKLNTAEIIFANGSHIMPITFGDRNWGKTKSYLFSLVILEEGTEFEDQFYTIENSGFDLLKGRINRLAHVRENMLIIATNPDEPGHFLHSYFIEGEKDHYNRFVFYSETDKNPYLDPNYIKQLRASYSPLMAERYLRGRWISLAGKGIYHAFTDKNVLRKDYEINPNYPIYVSFDFNIGVGKPLSAIMYQYIGKIFHFFAESIIEGAYTYEGVDDFYNRGLINRDQFYIIQGDATGRARDTSSKQNNYDVIEEFLSRRFIQFEMDVPRSNPPIRTRHSIVNAQCCNDLNQVRVFFYKNTQTAIQGMKLTKLKQGANYIEDDSAKYQHVTTAIGYGICATLDTISQKRQGTVAL